MNFRTSTILCTLLLIFIGPQANAQWELFADLLNQMDDNTQNQFFNDLDNSNAPNTDQQDLNLALDHLFSSLNDPCHEPGGGLDQSFIDRLNECLDDLNEMAPNSGLPGSDQDTLLGELDRINDLFNMNFDSLGGLYDNYQDSIGSDPEWDVTIFGYDDMVDENLAVLEDSVNLITDPNFFNNPADIASILGQLFSQSLFLDLELAFGIQNADLKYYNDSYSAAASVIRVGSVPRFDRTVVQCHDGILRLPLEPFWHVQESFVSGRIPNSINNDVHNAFENDNNFNSLLMFGDYGMMATPSIGRTGTTDFKLVTSLGMEFGTYVPAHREYNPYRTSVNKGYTTGFGPQIGSGFAAITGPLTIYSIGTVATGNLFKTDQPYRYSSVRVEAGVRYGNAINIRYTNAWVNWQDKDNRRANINHQLTIGIILGSLHSN